MPPGVAEGAVGVSFCGDIPEQIDRNLVFVKVALDLHRKELGGQHHAGVAVPLG